MDPDGEPPPPFVEPNESTRLMASFVRDLTRCADAVIYLIIHEPSDSKKRRMLLPMVWSLGNSCGTLRHLALRGDYRAAYVVARGIVETTVNTFYLMVAGDEVIDRAERHALQKVGRRVQQSSTIGDSTIKTEYRGPGGVPAIPEHVRAAIEEFTSKSGRERSWSELSVPQRIEFVGGALGPRVLTALHFAYDSLYGHASEIIHGTYFGALFAMGLAEPSGRSARSKEEVIEFVNDHLTMTLMLTALAVRELLAHCARDLGNERLVEIFVKVGESQLGQLDERWRPTTA